MNSIESKVNVMETKNVEKKFDVKYRCNKMHIEKFQVKFKVLKRQYFNSFGFTKNTFCINYC